MAISVFATIAVGTIASAGTSDSRVKTLSLPDVTITAGMTATPSLLFIAQAQGFFKSNGLKMTFIAGASAAAQTATLLGGSAQFSIDAPASDFPAVSQGAPIRGLLQSAKDSPQELAITTQAATQYDIPLSGGSTKAAVAQLMALKGSHIVMAESNVTSGSYVALVAVARAHGLSIGVGCATCDINVTTTGTPAAEQADIESGKVQAIGNNPPVTVIASPPTIIIQLWRIPPLPSTAANYLVTTTSMIQQHADTVQAVVTSFAEASIWQKTHEARAEQDVASYLTSFGFTSPEEQQYLYTDVIPFLGSPFPSKASFNTALSLVDDAASTPASVTYSSFVVTKFISNAAIELHTRLAG